MVTMYTTSWCGYLPPPQGRSRPRGHRVHRDRHRGPTSRRPTSSLRPTGATAPCRRSCSPTAARSPTPRSTRSSRSWPPERAGSSRALSPDRPGPARRVSSPTTWPHPRPIVRVAIDGAERHRSGRAGRAPGRAAAALGPPGRARAGRRRSGATRRCGWSTGTPTSTRCATTGSTSRPCGASCSIRSARRQRAVPGVAARPGAPIARPASRAQPRRTELIVLLSGQFLLGHELPFDRVIRLSASAAALARATPAELAWTLPVIAAYEAEIEPDAQADIDIRRQRSAAPGHPRYRLTRSLLRSRQPAGQPAVDQEARDRQAAAGSPVAAPSPAAGRRRSPSVQSAAWATCSRVNQPASAISTLSGRTSSGAVGPGGEAEHQRGRERPGLAGHVAHVVDDDADLFEHLADHRRLERLPRLDEPGQGRVTTRRPGRRRARAGTGRRRRGPA